MPTPCTVNGTYRAYHRCDQAVIVTISSFTPTRSAPTPISITPCASSTAAASPGGSPEAGCLARLIITTLGSSWWGVPTSRADGMRAEYEGRWHELYWLYATASG
ncbi:hypothetical protein [Streptomyces decoyicus]|uniref:hypothetical protein n=1 Tax=Streptomyces decoyicus TaxID=249567 RepID=UPI000A6C0A5A|nr:hypothetical protein [Streptomyces decoyicus]QZY20159.1 hypothetical protein K7C20_37240 [Streptomyces decoyicus]